MRTKPNAREWIDADVWARYLRRQWAPALPPDAPLLTFTEAALVAEAGNFKYEHQSDGGTLIEVGFANVAAASIWAGSDDGRIAAPLPRR